MSWTHIIHCCIEDEVYPEFCVKSHHALKKHEWEEWRVILKDRNTNTGQFSIVHNNKIKRADFYYFFVWSLMKHEYQF